MFEEFTVYPLSSVVSDDDTSAAKLSDNAKPILLPAGLLDAVKTITESDTLFRLQALLGIIFMREATDRATDDAASFASDLYTSHLMTNEKLALFESERKKKSAGKLLGPQDEAEALRWLLRNFNLEKSSADPCALYFVLVTSNINLSLLSPQDGDHFVRARMVKLQAEKQTSLKLSPTDETRDGLPVFSLTETVNIPEENRLVKGKSDLFRDVSEEGQRAIEERFGTVDNLYVFDFAEHEDGSLSIAPHPLAHAAVLSLRARSAGQIILERLPGSSTETEIKFVVRGITNASGFLRAQGADMIEASSLVSTLHAKKAFFSHHEDHSLGGTAAASAAPSTHSLGSRTSLSTNLVEQLKLSAATSQRASADASPVAGGKLAAALTRLGAVVAFDSPRRQAPGTASPSRTEERPTL